MSKRKRRSISLSARAWDHLDAEAERLGVSWSEVLRRDYDAILDGKPAPPRPVLAIPEAVAPQATGPDHIAASDWPPST